jgi:hypothetical protein
VHYAAGLDGQGAIAVKLQFILKLRAFPQLLRAQEEHGLDERGLDLLIGHRRLISAPGNATAQTPPGVSRDLALPPAMQSI